MLLGAIGSSSPGDLLLGYAVTLWDIPVSATALLEIYKLRTQEVPQALLGSDTTHSYISPIRGHLESCSIVAIALGQEHHLPLSYSSPCRTVVCPASGQGA